MSRCFVCRSTASATRFVEGRRFLSTPSSNPQYESSGHQSDEVGGQRGAASKSLFENALPTNRSSPFRRPLPISPLMDPAFLSSRQKHHAPKSPPSKEPTLFQQQLAKNPYALALATPLRLCTMTKVALPRYFLQDFNPIAHPETGQPWYMPRSLTSQHKNNIVGKQRALHIIGNETVEENSEHAESTNEAQREDRPTPRIGPCVYTLARKELLLQMRKGGPHKRFPSERLRKYKESNKVLIHAQWREDMDVFILELMRRRVVEQLVYIANLKRGYLVGCTGWEDAMAKPQVGALLWTGSELETSDEPSQFATLFKSKEKQRKVPVHNLQILLGSEKLGELRRKIPSGIFTRQLLAVKHKRITAALQMKLWKMQGYLAEYEEASNAEELSKEAADYEK